MTPKKSQMNRKHWHPKQKGKNYTNIKQATRQKNNYHTIKTNIKNINKYKETKYQPTKEERPTKYKTINKPQPEHAQADTPSPKLKTE